MAELVRLFWKAPSSPSSPVSWNFYRSFSGSGKQWFIGPASGQVWALALDGGIVARWQSSPRGAGNYFPLKIEGPLPHSGGVHTVLCVLEESCSQGSFGVGAGEPG